MVFFRCYSTFLHIFISHLLGWLHCPARLLTRSVLGRRPSIHAHCRFLFRPAFSWLVHVSHFFFSPFLASAGGGAGWGDGSVSRLVEREGGDRRGGGGGKNAVGLRFGTEILKQGLWLGSVANGWAVGMRHLFFILQTGSMLMVKSQRKIGFCQTV